MAVPDFYDIAKLGLTGDALVDYVNSQCNKSWLKTQIECMVIDSEVDDLTEEQMQVYLELIDIVIPEDEEES